MAGRGIKNRIKSTKNIRQMTRAMEAVSAVKMRKSVGLALAARPYAFAALETLARLESGLSTDEEFFFPLLTKRPDGKTTLLVITSDKGLAGAFNASVIRKTEKVIAEEKSGVEIIAVGKKGRDYFRRKGLLIKEFLGAGDFGATDETRPIADFLVDYFKSGEVRKIDAIYTNFQSALKQEVVIRPLLPFDLSALRKIIEETVPERGRFSNTVEHVPKPEIQSGNPLLLEPSPAALLEKILPELLAIQIHQSILEANASEHSSRMIAMKNASENAKELMDKLSIIYNKGRQAQITKELTEITAGAAALQT